HPPPKKKQTTPKNNQIRKNNTKKHTKIKYWYKTSYGLNMINKTNISKKNIFSRIIIVFKIMLRGGKNDSNSMDN
ncbi:hypothetical protein JOC61_002102, partial [Marinitoga litoralis]|nr:hypothetical protein [Marinitoga litoralis]